jgi:hypothetical protein
LRWPLVIRPERATTTSAAVIGLWHVAAARLSRVFGTALRPVAVAGVVVAAGVLDGPRLGLTCQRSGSLLALVAAFLGSNPGRLVGAAHVGSFTEEVRRAQ